MSLQKKSTQGHIYEMPIPEVHLGNLGPCIFICASQRA